MRTSLLKPKKSIHPDPWITLAKIQQVLGWSDEELSERLGLDPKRMLMLRVQKKTPSVHSMGQLVSEIGLSLETIVTGKIDFQALSAHTSGNLFYLPERYSHVAFSKRRTSISLLSYLEDHFGWETKKHVMNHLQVNEAIFSDPEAPISFYFPFDLTSYLIQIGFATETIRRMGAYSVVSNQNSPLAKLMASFGGPRNLYERVFSDVVGKSFDRNYDYRLMSLGEDDCVVEGVFSQELKDSLKEEKPGSRLACEVRAGGFSSLTGYLRLPHSKIVEESCVYHGDASCQYRITFDEAQYYYRARLFPQSELSH